MLVSWPFPYYQLCQLFPILLLLYIIYIYVYNTFDLKYHCFVGKNFCMAQIEELLANPGSLSCHEQIHNIIMFLKQSEGLSKHVDSFMQILSLVQFKDTPPFVLTPVLPDEMHEADFLR